VLVDQKPIAVFDSGIGGLTVVRELRRRLPHEDIVYFGDTARVPYGTKTPDTVLRFARENCAFLMRMNPKCIVAACNTASAVCLPELQAETPVPLIGVVAPGAAAAVEAATHNRLIAIVATEATVTSNAYKNAVSALDATRPVVQVACPLFVPMVEEGIDPNDAIVRLLLKRYLAPLRRIEPAVVILGCTHYPMLRPALQAFFGDSVHLIDSGTAAAVNVGSTLQSLDALSESTQPGSLHCYVSDNPRRFQAVGWRFLGEPVPDVVRVCTDGLTAQTSPWSAPQPRASA
jgi:glutamate racemase